MLKLLLNIVLIVFAFVLCALFCELGARVLLFKGDYLKPYLFSDYKLGWVIKPYSAGHDKWGFRNKYLPNNVDIVAIGDSQTYGYAALSKDSWPSQLARETNNVVYNMGIGGYGPVQYYYLLKEKAIKLKPKIIIVGFYIGNDLLDTYDMIYHYQYWAEFRNRDYISKDSNMHLIGEKPHHENKISIDNQDGRKFNLFRQYLSHHSVLYELVTNSFIGEFVRWREESSRKRDDILVIDDKEHNIKTCFKSGGRIVAMDVNKKEVKEGLVKSFLLIHEMKTLCDSHNIKFVVVIIPIKEMVYSDYIKFYNTNLIFKEIEYGLYISDLTKAMCNTNGIKYIELLHHMQKAIGGNMMYPTNLDSHPNKYGYHIIASEIAKYLQNNNMLSTQDRPSNQK